MVDLREQLALIQKQQLSQQELLHSKPKSVLKNSKTKREKKDAEKKQQSDSSKNEKKSSQELLREAIRQRKKNTGKQIVLNGSEELQRRAQLLKQE